MVYPSPILHGFGYAVPKRSRCETCGGVKNKGAVSKCPLGQPLRIDSNCSPIGLTDDPQ